MAQKLSFEQLYTNAKEAVRSRLTSMWCDNPLSESQRNYAEQLRKLIDTEVFAPRNAMPLVQCMDRYKSIDAKEEQIKELVGDLWKKDYPPYKHQYECWKALSEVDGKGRKKSIVVTSGTGSGKTECFMLPLIHDLCKSNNTGQVEAIILYPLNALMEDQLARWNEYLDGTNLKFAVYNGSTIERENDDDPILTRRLSDLRTKYRHMLATRREIRQTPPNILLTNPSMLEYLMIRHKDHNLFQQGSLKWVVIDETHTYTGAGAAELAMLMRRVLLAFNVTPENVRFATSSATIGNKKSDRDALADFICGVSGQSKEQLVIVDGERDVPQNHTAEVARCQKIMHTEGQDGYVRLDTLFPEGKNIEEKLRKLDKVCEDGLKAKVHFFFRVLNNGFKVRLDKFDKDGCFKIYTEIPIYDNDNTPYLELMRCQQCGEYVAIGKGEVGKDTYSAIERENPDMFDFSNDSSSKFQQIVFGLSNTKDDLNGENKVVEIIGNTYKIVDNIENGKWHLVMNTSQTCTNCAERFYKRPDAEEDADVADLELKRIRSFNISADYVARVITPSLLSQLKEYDDALPHAGQQFISFVDSRQAASKSTLDHNLEEERVWILSRVFHKLNERALSGNKAPMTWNEVYDFLREQPESVELCWQFIDRSEGSEEREDVWKPNEKYLAKYLYTVMIEQLSKRPREAAAPETMGLFTACYPKLDSISQLPNEVEVFNQDLSSENKISISDWKDLLTIFLNRTVRSNMSIYLKDTTQQIDIFMCQRFQSQKAPRRPVHEPRVTNTGRQPLVIQLLAKLYGSNDSINSITKNHIDALNKVCEALWRDLTETTKLLRPSEKFNKDTHHWQRDEENGEPQYRLNVEDIAFRLYEKVFLVPVRTIGSQPLLRPFDVSFKGFTTPYAQDEPHKLSNDEFSTWEVFPYIKGKRDGQNITNTDIQTWAQQNRADLCAAGLWGEYGTFTDRLMRIYSYPQISIQAEHTAQVDKHVKQESQIDFIEHRVNILACSTTMEMGVDLGDLELVLLNSVPPQPANYKQRAGRSGRNLEFNKSVCITLCGSDAIGLRTMRNPLHQIISRVVAVPTIDLQSAQVIQRHVNSFLLRESGVLAIDNNCETGLEIIDFFTHRNFRFDQGRRNGRMQRNYQIVKCDNTIIYLDAPEDQLCPTANSPFSDFLDFLNQKLLSNDSDFKNQIKTLLNNTLYQYKCNDCINQTKADILRCKEELYTRIKELSTAFTTQLQQKNYHNGSELWDKDNYGRLLMYKYFDILGRKLIDFLSTNRFLPNANMPVNIVEFDIQSDTAPWFQHNTNPSYALREAISQYAPGNSIVLSNRVFKVRGLQSQGQFAFHPLKKLYTDGNRTVIDHDTQLSNRQEWPVSGKDYVELVEPLSFIPDKNEESSREVDKQKYSVVSAQLLGTAEWNENPLHRMFKIRNNKDCGQAKILYYNEGKGFGYCYCMRCGKTVLENHACKNSSPLYQIPSEFNNLEKQGANNTPQEYHTPINVTRAKQKCYGSNHADCVRRNVVIGGLLQTDYSEICIRRDVKDGWIDQLSEDSRSLLTTLGIVFCRAFAEYQGIEARDIDFVVMQNGHLCLFDTNSGGSGYCNRLANIQIMSIVIQQSKEIVDGISSKEEILDRFTLRYANNLDIEGAKQWLEKVIEDAQRIPDNIKNKYTNARPAFYHDIEDFAHKSSDCTLYVNSQWDSWNYDDDDINWKMRIASFRKASSDKPKLCLLSQPEDQPIPTPMYKTLQAITDWADLIRLQHTAKDNIYPVAYVNGHLFITDDINQINANSHWANDRVFCVDLENNPYASETAVNTTPPADIIRFVIDDTKTEQCNSKDLGKIIDSQCQDIIDDFTKYCNNNNSQMKVIYQDKYLRSEMGIITTLQFIDYFKERFNKPEVSLIFNLAKYSESRPARKISHNIVDYDSRDRLIKRLCPEAQIIEYDEYSSTLPHWRCLTFRYGKKELNFYPDGGIINGWGFDYKNNDRIKEYSSGSIDTSCSIPLTRKEKIMYSVDIKDIEQ